MKVYLFLLLLAVCLFALISCNAAENQKDLSSIDTEAEMTDTIADENHLDAEVHDEITEESEAVSFGGDESQNNSNSSENGASDQGASEPIEEQGSSQHYLIDMSSQNSISLELPIICEENEQIKDFICEYLDEKIYEFCGERFDYIEQDTDMILSVDSEYYIDLDCRTVYASESFASIIFEGFFNMENSAHPTNLFFTLNYSYETNESVLLKDVYETDNGLYELFNKYVILYFESNADTQGLDATVITDLYDEQRFLSGLQYEREICTYFTEDSLGISFAVPHVLGDHIEIEIPYDEL